MSKVDMNKFIASSANPKELSLVIKGALVAVAPLVALVIKAAGGEVSNDDLQSLIDVVTDIVVTLGSLVSLVMMGYGLVRRAKNSFKK